MKIAQDGSWMGLARLFGDAKKSEQSCHHATNGEVDVEAPILSVSSTS